MPRIAVILSGCGYLDGSEIYESVLTFLHLEQEQLSYQSFAPDMPQSKVVNHMNTQDMAEQRNVLIESARLTRGQVKALSELDVSKFDGLIFPGGFGAALNLCDFAQKGEQATVLPDIEKLTKAFHQAKKPIGFICIAPALIPLILGKGIELTIGNDAQTAEALEKMGASHQSCDVEDFVADDTHRIASTPAYMLGQSITEVSAGIGKLVSQIKAWV